jgi:hypothetical protein
MLFKEFILDYNNVVDISLEIKKFFYNEGECCIIRNFNHLSDNDIIKFYENLNSKIGQLVPIDLDDETYKPNNNFWTNVRYDYSSDEKQFWRSSNHQNLHTDNSFAYSNYYANLTQLVCLKPVEYSGNTTLISNSTIIELIKFVDEKLDTKLFDKILNKFIYFSCESNFQIKKPILVFNSEKNKYIFNFNYFPAKRGKNTEQDCKIIEELNFFLEEKITHSNLMCEFKLNKGDALIFNDELVMHGRRSFIGTRHYIKCGINIENLSLVNNLDYKCEAI